MKSYWKIFWSGMLISVLFVALIGVMGSRLDAIELLPDQGASWYYWKLPKRSFWPMLTAWGFYVAHQITVWLLIYLAQFKDKSKRQQYRNWLLILNFFFILLHIFQTHIWYDGLAQDVPVMSSQGSVIVMLVVILIMDTQRRGLFFGKKIKKVPGLGEWKSVVKPFRKYHGYFFAWAIVYTFWYHPTVATSGHLVGFFYMFLLFLQMAMIYTPVHTNKYWTFALEVLVLFHGTTVAIKQANNMWPMFLFGFATMAVVTQVYGLQLKTWLRTLIQGIYLVGVVIVFGGFTGHRTLGEIHQVLWIPIIEYGLVFVFVYVVGGIKKLTE